MDALLNKPTRKDEEEVANQKKPFGWWFPRLWWWPDISFFNFTWLFAPFS